ALIDGFRVNPRFDPMVFRRDAGDPRARAREIELLNDPVATQFFTRGDETLLERLRPPSEVSFLFSMVDTATGRELQDAPINNLPALGRSDGERPFRVLAQPLAFAPRSTVRMQVLERSLDVKGTLFVVLYGYKVLGGPDCLGSMARRLEESARSPSVESS